MENSLWQHHDDLTAACASAFPDLAAIIQAAPGADYTIKGSKIPRQAHRYSGRTAMHANIKVSEPGQPHDLETPFAFSMEGDTAQVPPALLPVIWAPGWNSNQSISKFQEETGGHLRDGDAGIRLLEASGTLPWFSDIPPAFKPEPGLWRIMPLPHIFGSEELSLHSPSIAERLPPVCALLSPLDAEVLQVDTGDDIEIGDLAGDPILKIPVQIELTLPRGLLGITAGRPEFQSIKSLAQVTLKKVNQEGHIMNAGLGDAADIIGILVSVIVVAALLIWVERRLLAVWQDRLGPNRVGPLGLMQVVADMIKMFFKEDWIPPFADKLVFVLAPTIVFITMLTGFAVIPFAPGVGIIDFNFGLLYFLALSSLSVYSVVLAGYASNNKYSLLGGTPCSSANRQL